MSADDGLEIWAPAKINLYLRLTGKRADGYHLLNSVFVFADLADHLTAKPANGLSLETKGPWAGALAGEADSDNLVLRAARLLLAEMQCSASVPGAHLTLTKNIPVAAGIGGGSADAAAALKLLMRLWGVILPDKRLMVLAEELGADVPSCLVSRPVHVRGTGELMTPLGDNPDWGILLVNPRVAVSTAQIFKTYGQEGAGFSHDDTGPGDWRDLDWLSRQSRNDLEAPAMKIAPVIGSVLAALRSLQSCRLVRMSGSGATCFALFDDKDQAQRAEKVISSQYPQWWCRAGGFHEPD